jgi:D-3-phosphoglycerate dehydrogenase
MKHKIILAATLTPHGIALLQEAEDVQLVTIPPSPEALAPHLATAKALIVNDQLTIDGAVMAAAPGLEIIARAGASLENIALDEATRRGIIVMNTPGVDAVTVAEYTFTLMLAILRKPFPAYQHLLSGDWQAPTEWGYQLKGKTLGVVGYGRVGIEIASRALAFGLEVLIADPYVRESQVAGQRLKLVGNDELYARSDIITLHTTVIPETHHLLNAHTLGRMKRGVFLLNIKHHSLMDIPAMKEALDSGQVAGLALDDFDPAALEKGHPLIGHPKVIHTQRMRYYTHEAQRDLSSLLVPQLLDALRKTDYRNAVNLPFIPGREYDVIQPQMQLAERIGIILYHLGGKSPIERVEISIQGDEMEGMLKPLTVGLLKGLLAPSLGAAVNYINAPVIAHERGISVTQSPQLGLDSYPNLLICQVFWEDGRNLVAAGAIFNHTEPRIVQLDQYRTDFIPEGVLLIMGSYDVPGVIGRVGTYMATHSINIAGWRTSRENKGGNTLSVIGIDEPLAADMLDDLRQKDFVRHATQIIF